MNTATNTVSGFEDCNLKAGCSEQPGSSKPAYASSDDADLPRPALKTGMHTRHNIHPDLPESDQVFAKRVKLFPEGCLALIEGDSDELSGYVISHPIRRRQPPALNSLLGELASDADQYYIHDLAILREARGRGLAQECIGKLFEIAKRYPTTSLVSVYNTAPFWGRFGFVSTGVDEGLEKKLLDYGEDATYLERKNEERAYR
ncbi:MAG: hypothetical protein LQ343_002871 [Gyalolechia ehrenbergii]|nr:MAG: hypothetical protein LQ343_002871 [Gyalolechia ehrenbergii]